MKKIYTYLGVIFCCLCGAMSSVNAQQVPISNLYIYQPHLFNPASKGTIHLNRFLLSHQQRRSFFGLSSFHQTLTYSSKALNDRDKMGWGFQIINDAEHADRRLSMNFSLSYHLLNNVERDEWDEEFLGDGYRLSIGGMGGLLNLSENYNGIPVHDGGDPHLRNQNFNRLDLGVGIDGYYQKGILRVQGGGALLQLPEWLEKTRGDTMVVIPHAFAHASMMLWLTEGMWIGPWVLYKEELGSSRGIGAAQLDANLKIDLINYNLWAGGGYRIGNSAINAAAGWRFIDKDSTWNGRYFPRKWDLTGVFEYPINDSYRFGPTFEIGLGCTFGDLRKVKFDTVDVYRGPFWVSTGNMWDLMDEKVADQPLPSNLYLRSDNDKNKVVLTYEFEDNVYQFNTNDNVGLEALLTHLAKDVLRIPFEPEDERDLDYHAHLLRLESIEFHAWLKNDEIAASFLADSILYTEDSIISEKVLYDEKDSVLSVRPGRITNLGLAFLKLYKTREYFKFHGHGPLGTYPQLANVEIKPLKITSNNPNLEAWQKNTITLVYAKSRGKMKRKKRKGR